MLQDFSVEYKLISVLPCSISWSWVDWQVEKSQCHIRTSKLLIFILISVTSLKAPCDRSSQPMCLTGAQPYSKNKKMRQGSLEKEEEKKPQLHFQYFLKLSERHQKIYNTKAKKTILWSSRKCEKKVYGRRHFCAICGSGFCVLETGLWRHIR